MRENKRKQKKEEQLMFIRNLVKTFDDIDDQMYQIANTSSKDKENIVKNYIKVTDLFNRLFYYFIVDSEETLSAYKKYIISFLDDYVAFRTVWDRINFDLYNPDDKEEMEFLSLSAEKTISDLNHSFHILKNVFDDDSKPELERFC